MMAGVARAERVGQEASQLARAADELAHRSHVPLEQARDATIVQIGQPAVRIDRV